MSDSSGQWVKGCAIGCGAIALIVVLFMVGMTFSVRSAFDDAQRDRETLASEHGARDSYTPPVTGVVAPDRVEAFLRVRDAMAGALGGIEAIDHEMGEFEQLADNDEPPPMRVALPAIARLTKTMFGMPWVLGDIERTRNRALVDNGMGLGEYSYLYFVAFHDRIVDPGAGSQLFGDSAVNRRVRSELRAMLHRQRDAAAAELPDNDPWLAALDREVAALDGDHSRIPWQNGLPEPISSGLAPFGDRIDATYSAAAAELELLNSTVGGGGLNIQMN